jgi:hypothetical protein
MEICVLSHEEVGRVKHYGLLPNHDEHYHIPYEDALRGLENEVYELVHVAGDAHAVTRSRTYFIERRPSGPLDTIQRVVSNHIEALKPIR